MNPYSKLLENSLIEIDQYSLSEEGVKWNENWYLNLKGLVAKAANAESQEYAEEIMDAISRSIVDSGPLDSEFSPSLKQAQETLIKVRRKRKNEKH